MDVMVSLIVLITKKDGDHLTAPKRFECPAFWRETFRISCVDECCVFR